MTALIRSLPKQLRVNFVPAPDVARRFLETVPPGEEPLLDALSRYLRSLTGVHVPREAWDLEKVPGPPAPDLPGPRRPGRGGRRRQGPRRAQGAAASLLRPRDAQVADESGVSATGQTEWTFGTIEPSFTQTRAGHEVRGYPRSSTRAPTVGLRVTASADEQEAHHRLGVRRLLLLAVPSPVGALVDGLDNAAKLGLAASPYPNVARAGRGLRRRGGR